MSKYDGGILQNEGRGRHKRTPLNMHWGSVQAVRPIGGADVHPFMTTALEEVRDQRHAPAALYPRERPGTHCTGGWVGPRAGLDRCGKSRLTPRFDPRTVQPVTSRYTDSATRPTGGTKDSRKRWKDHLHTDELRNRNYT